MVELLTYLLLLLKNVVNNIYSKGLNDFLKQLQKMFLKQEEITIGDHVYLLVKTPLEL